MLGKASGYEAAPLPLIEVMDYIDGCARTPFASRDQGPGLLGGFLASTGLAVDLTPFTYPAHHPEEFNIWTGPG